jgi:hypothetical protein
VSRLGARDAPHLRAAARLAGPLALLAALLLGGCAAEGVGVAAGYDEGYWGAPGVDYDMDFDEPFGFGYGGYGYGGGWGPGYFIGPPGVGFGGPRGGGGGGPRPYHPAPLSRPVPSIPHGARGPGMRGLPR